MVNARKEEDRKSRILILDALKSALRVGNVPAAKEIAESSHAFAEKLRTHDYSKDETFEQTWQRKVNEGCQKNGLPNIYSL